MVLSGSFRQTFNNNGLHDIIMEWSATQNIAGNYSDITATMYLKGNHSQSTIYSGSVAKPSSITIDGVKSPITYARIDISGFEKRSIMSFKKRVQHDVNGDGSFTLQGIIDVGINWNGRWESSYRTSSRRFYLNRIQRASSLRLHSSTINYGDKLRFTINSQNSSFRHIVKLNVAGFNGTIMSNQTGGDKEYQTSLNWITSLTTSVSSNATITLDTYSGNSRIGSSSYNIGFNVPSNIVPSISSVAHMESNMTVRNGIGLQNNQYIQGMSLIQFSITSSGSYGAKINTTEIFVKGTKINGVTVDLSLYKDMSGSIPCEVQVRDSRGRLTSWRGNINIIAYSPPTISSFIAERNGSNVTIKRSGVISKIIIGGVDKNITQSRIYIKEYNQSNWTERGSVVNHFTNTSIPNVDRAKSFNIKTVLSDKFSQATSVMTISTDKVLLNLHEENGVGIGKMHERGVLDVGGDSYFNGRANLLNGASVAGGMSVAGGITAVNGYNSILIPSGADLNSYTTTGVYYCHANVYVATMKNVPEKMAFSLLVEKHAGIKQTFTTYDTVFRMYVRNYYNGVWGGWVCVIGEWIRSIPANSGFRQYNTGTYNEPVAYRSGSTVTIGGAFSPTSSVRADGGAIMGILPVGFRPMCELNTRTQGSGGATLMLTIKPNGEIHCSRYSHNGDYKEIPIGHWLNISFTYTTGKELPI